jgi:hypothetical protein
MVSLNDNSVLLSNADMMSFNVTSQEIFLTNTGAQRLALLENGLYDFSNVVSLRVNGQEIYQGVFRTASMSALPQQPKIAILYPSMDLTTGTENDHAIRLFFPSFQPPSDLIEMNTKFTQYFQDAGKLVH